MGGGGGERGGQFACQIHMQVRTGSTPCIFSIKIVLNDQMTEEIFSFWKKKCTRLRIFDLPLYELDNITIVIEHLC